MNSDTTNKNDVEISKVVNIGLDINITKALTVSKLVDPVLIYDRPAELERYVLSEMSKQLIAEGSVDWNVLDEAYYLLKLTKKKNKTSDIPQIPPITQYKATLYPSKLNSKVERVPVPVHKGFTYFNQGEWIIEMSGNDIASAYPTFTCSACGGSSLLQKTPYCPYCGGKMTNGYHTPRK